MNFFTFDLRKLIIVLTVMALPVLSINMQRAPGDPPWYEAPFVKFVGFLQTGYASFTSGVRTTTSLYLDLIGIKKTNIQLLRDNAELRAQLGAMTELKLENVRLNSLLDFRRETRMKLIAGKIVARDLSPERESIRINRGYRQGVRRFMGVITVEGVVGYVTTAELDHSQVLLLTDSSAAIDALVQRTRARGLLGGHKRQSCRLRYLERAENVAVGDRVVTSGSNGYFPKGFPIGVITAVRKTDVGISQEAYLDPIVSPTQLEEVFVVLDAGGDEIGDRVGSFGPPLLSKQEVSESTALSTEPAAASPVSLPSSSAPPASRKSAGPGNSSGLVPVHRSGR